MPHGPLARYVKLRVRMRRECRERFPRHRRWAIPTCITARASRTCRDACRDRQLSVSFEIGGGGKRSRHSRRMRNLQFYVSGKRPMYVSLNWIITGLDNGSLPIQLWLPIIQTKKELFSEKCRNLSIALKDFACNFPPFCDDLKFSFHILTLNVHDRVVLLVSRVMKIIHTMLMFNTGRFTHVLQGYLQGFITNRPFISMMGCKYFQCLNVS